MGVNGTGASTWFRGGELEKKNELSKDSTKPFRFESDLGEIYPRSEKAVDVDTSDKFNDSVLSRRTRCVGCRYIGSSFLHNK